MITPRVKASCGTTIFSASVLYAWFFLVDDKVAALPLLLFYAALMVNTYFSVKLFSGIVPAGDRKQIFFDVLLFALNFLLALSISDFAVFAFFDLLLFIFASMKYAFMLGEATQPKLLKRKIIVDMTGALAVALSLAGVFYGYGFLTSWLLSLSFVTATVLLFSLFPLYRLDAVSGR